MSLLSPALDEFLSGVDEILEHVSFIELSSSLQPKLNGFLNWPGINAEQQGLCRAFMKTRIDGSPVIQGLFLRLMSGFENALRRMVRDSIGNINKRKMSFAKLDPTLRNRNRISVGRALTSVTDPYSHHQFNLDDLCMELGTCVPQANLVILSAEAFAISAKGSGPTLIEGAFDILGASLDWNRVGADVALKAFLKETGTNKASKLVQDRLTDMQKKRNAYAHTGMPGSSMSAEELKEFCKFIRLVMSPLKLIMEAHVTALI